MPMPNQGQCSPQITLTGNLLIMVPALCGPPPGWILGWIIGYPGIFAINKGRPEILPPVLPIIRTSAQFIYISLFPIALIQVHAKVHLSQLGKLKGNWTGQLNPSKEFKWIMNSNGILPCGHGPSISWITINVLSLSYDIENWHIP